MGWTEQYVRSDISLLDDLSSRISLLRRLMWDAGTSPVQERNPTVTNDEPPRGYDHERTTRTTRVARRRFGYSHEQGEVRRFMVQLEYRTDDGWTPVVRYDHDAVTDHGGHDVTEEGLHIDVYRDGEKYEREFIAPPMPPAVALDLAEDHLRENAPRFIKRFEEWHGIGIP